LYLIADFNSKKVTPAFNELVAFAFKNWNNALSNYYLIIKVYILKLHQMYYGLLVNLFLLVNDCNKFGWLWSFSYWEKQNLLTIS